MNHILNHIKKIKYVMMMNTVNQFRYVKEKMMFIS